VLQAIEALLEAIGAVLETIEAVLEAIEARLETIEPRLETIEARLKTIEARLETIEARLERTNLVGEQAHSLRDRLHVRANCFGYDIEVPLDVVHAFLIHGVMLTRSAASWGPFLGLIRSGRAGRRQAPQLVEEVLEQDHMVPVGPVGPGHLLQDGGSFAVRVQVEVPPQGRHADPSAGSGARDCRRIGRRARLTSDV